MRVFNLAVLVDFSLRSLYGLKVEQVKFQLVLHSCQLSKSSSSELTCQVHAKKVEGGTVDRSVCSLAMLHLKLGG